MKKFQTALGVFAGILLAIFSVSAIACMVAIHYIYQPSPNFTQVQFGYSCTHGVYAYCSIVIKKNGATVATHYTQSTNNTGFSFDHGAGSFEVTVNAYTAIPVRGAYLYSLNTSTTSTIIVNQPPTPVSVGTTRYFYDANGRLKKVEEDSGATTQYGYDDANNRTSKTTTK